MIVVVGSALVEAVQERVSTESGLSFDGPRGARQRQMIQVQLQRALDEHPELPEESVALAPETIQRVSETLTVQESFFYRERGALDWLARHVLPALRDRGRPVSAWSAGCAEGQETYTLAAALQDAGLRGRYRILGTDLSASAVEAARRGVYGLWSLRGLGHSLVSHLLHEEAGHFTVRERFREGLDFAQHNLMGPPPPRAEVGFDLILCRNVLIYLTPTAQQRVGAGLAEALAPGGWLLTGAADPLMDGTPGLVPVATGHGPVYRRQDSSASAVERSPQRARQATGTGHGPGSTAARPAPARARSSRGGATVSELLTAAEAALESARPGQAERLARQAIEQQQDDGRGHVVLVQALAQSGRTAEAARASARAVARRPLDAALWHLRAVVLLDTGDSAAAAAAAERATSLDPGMAQAHLALARGRAALGDRAGALRARAVGRRLLGQGAVTR